MPFRQIANPLRIGSLRSGQNSVEVEPKAVTECLSERISRAKARWLRRVMYESVASSTEKCFAYAVADHLNCVTLDCWPSQLRLAKLLNFKSEKTLQRAARGLERIGVLTLQRGSRQGYRYAPVFLASDADKNDGGTGQRRPNEGDKNVRESLLLIHLKESVKTEEATEKEKKDWRYQPSQRGSIELALAERLGPTGLDVLGRLALVDDRIVDRLCHAQAMGALTERELAAARLAAEQAK